MVLDLGTSPLADAFPATPEVEERWPLRLAVCPSCWLAQLMDVVPDELLWSDYGFHASSSPSLVAYHREYAAWALRRFGEQANRLTVEVACNDGSLLRHFAAAGCPAVGVDPAGNVARHARERGLDVVVAPFGRAVAEDLVADRGPAGLVVANNVLAHVADLGDFCEGLRVLLAPGGVLLVEVQDLADLLLGNQVDHVYHEHRFFFTAATLAATLARHGLSVTEVHRTPAQGGSVRVVVQHFAPAATVVLPPGLARMDVYSSLQARANLLRGRLLELLHAERAAGRVVAGYAASAKSATLLNWCRIGPDLVPWVVDTTPHKIGRLTPGTHIPIVAPGDRPDPGTYLLLAHNYLPGVLRREAAFAATGGRWLVPIPQPVIL